MKIFSTHRRKLEPSRRFGGREFQNKVKAKLNYKRVFNAPRSGWLDELWYKIGLRSKLWRWGAFGVFIILFYFLILSPRFVVSDIRVSGNTQVSTQQIVDVIHHEGNSRIFLLKKASFFLLSRGMVNQMLTQNISSIKEVSEFKRIWPNKIELTVKERTPGFALMSNGKYFLVDDEGTVVKPLDDPQGLLVAEDSVVEDFASGESLPNIKMAPFIVTMSRTWPTKISTGISGVIFSGKASTKVQFTSVEGWAVFFDINRSVSTELSSLVTVINKLIAPKDRARLAYIDLGSNKFTYYCFKDTACQQKPLEEAPE